MLTGLSVVEVTTSQTAQAVDIGRQHGLLITDATHIAVMQSLRLTHLATGDADMWNIPGITAWAPYPALLNGSPPTHQPRLLPHSTTSIEPPYMPMLHINGIWPSTLGVNSMTSLPVAGSSFCTLKAGITNARAQV